MANNDINMSNRKDTIISIGGSVIYPKKGINADYLKELNQLVREKIATQNRRFFIFTGGGYVGKEYQIGAGKIVGKVKNNDLNWLGVHATRFNAHLLRTIFHDIAYPRVIVRYDHRPDIKDEKVVICAAWLPGASTDFDMVSLAKLLNIKRAITLLNTKGIFDKDPTKHSKVKVLPKISWSDYREMIGDWWDPKRDVPFDPFASKLAEDYGMKVCFLDGKYIKNLKNVLDNKSFTGTVVS